MSVTTTSERKLSLYAKPERLDDNVDGILYVNDSVSKKSSTVAFDELILLNGNLNRLLFLCFVKIVKKYPCFAFHK